MTTIALIGVPIADTWDMHDGGGAWMAAGMIGMTLFWGAIVLAFVWLVRGGIERTRRPPEETALTILDRRFAEGELSPEDYHRRRDVLTGATSSP